MFFEFGLSIFEFGVYLFELIIQVFEFELHLLEFAPTKCVVPFLYQAIIISVNMILSSQYPSFSCNLPVSTLRSFLKSNHNRHDRGSLSFLLTDVSVTPGPNYFVF